MRCPECASLRSTRLYQIGAPRLLLTGAATLAVGIIGASVISLLGFFVLLIGPAWGVAVAETALRVSGRKRGRVIEAIAVGSIIAGALLVAAYPMAVGLIGSGALHHLPESAPMLAASAYALLWPLIGVALAAASCFSKLRAY